MLNKKIAICHYRIGKTDGVSLEIHKRKKVLEERGYVVKLISGPLQEDADYVIPFLEFDRPDVLKIRHNAFEKLEDFKSDHDFENYINNISDKIKGDFLNIHKKENFDYLFIHNIFTHGRHIASAKAFYEIVEETKIKVISVNHDFYWVGSYKDIYKPTSTFVKKYLKKYVPPTLTSITHVAINSINMKALEKKIHQKAILLPDTFDFQQDPWVRDNYNKDFLGNIGVRENDLIILQATRITKRKGIEIAIDFAAELKKNKSKLIGKTLYNGKVLDRSSRIVLVLAGYTENDSLEYKIQLENEAKLKKVQTYFINGSIGALRKKENNKKVYSLWDIYVYSDIVTFPSLWEGWGNQLIEAIFAKKPIVIFEYPVYKADISKEGYKVISLGDKFLNRGNNKLVKVPKTNLKNAVNKAVEMLVSIKTKNILNDNFQAGEKYHSDIFLTGKLKEIIDAADSK